MSSSVSWPKAILILPFNENQKPGEETSIRYSHVKPGQLLIGVAGVLIPQPRLLQSWNPKHLLHHCLPR